MSFVLVHLCADIWSTTISNNILFLEIPLIFHVSVKHRLCVHFSLLALTCFIIDYHVNKNTPFQIFRCVSHPSIYNT